MKWEKFVTLLKQNFYEDNWDNVPKYNVGDVLTNCEECNEHILTEKSCSLLNLWLNKLKESNCPSPDYAELWCEDTDLKLVWMDYILTIQLFSFDNNTSEVMIAGPNLITKFHKLEI